MNWEYKKGLGFLVFVVIAGVMWFVFKYNEVYTQHIEVKVDWENIPASIEVSEEEPVAVDMELTASGFALLKALYVAPEVVLDFQDHVVEDNGTYYYRPAESTGAIKSQLSSDFKVEYITDQNIQIELVKFEKKKVALRDSFTLNFQENLQQVDEAHFSVDSVIITGNDKMIKNITELKLPPKELVVTDTVNSFDINLSSQFPELKIAPEQVTYTVNAAIMTEGSFIVPVKVINAPEDVVIKVIPSSVEVVYNSRLKNFQKIKAFDFEILVEYSTLAEDYNTVAPQLIYENELITSARMTPTQVQILQVR